MCNTRYIISKSASLSCISIKINLKTLVLLNKSTSQGTRPVMATIRKSTDKVVTWIFLRIECLSITVFTHFQHALHFRVSSCTCEVLVLSRRNIPGFILLSILYKNGFWEGLPTITFVKKLIFCF